MPPAARVTDMHTCPMVTVLVPHVGGPILPPGVPTVLIDFLPAATVTSMATCVGPPDTIIMGSLGVFIDFLPAARLGDPTAHGGVIILGSPTVMIGEIGAPSPGAGGMGAIVAGLVASAPADNPSDWLSKFGQGLFASPAAPATPESTAAAKTASASADVAQRVDRLQQAIPPKQQGRITMAVGVAEDSNGGRSVLVATSEPGGYLRPGVTLADDEAMVSGNGHAEANIVQHAAQNELKVVAIGATRPVCSNCQDAIAPTGAKVVTPLKARPELKGSPGSKGSPG